MKRLSRPPARYRRDLASILKMPEQRRYASTIQIACEQAREYSRRAPHLHSMRSRLRQPSVRVFFVGMYGSRRRAIIELKEDLRRLALTHDVMRAVCQYCGLSAPSTFDHYLEKARFPELSLYTRNLVPCCWACNHRRRASFGANGERQLLHFYEDDVDSMPEILLANVSIPAASGVPVVTYSVGTSTHPLQPVYNNHFRLLNLAERYRIQAAVDLRSLKQRFRLVSRSQLVAILLKEATDRAQIYGANDYLAALCRALAGSLPALDWMVR
jgi:5-methylcytosine-specific restriction endonuclease McrA